MDGEAWMPLLGTEEILPSMFHILSSTKAGDHALFIVNNGEEFLHRAYI